MTEAVSTTVGWAVSQVRMTDPLAMAAVCTISDETGDIGPRVRWIR